MNSIEIGDQHMMLFDGDCGICTYFADWVKRIDRRGLFQVCPYQSFSEDVLRRWGITYDDCARKLQVVSRRGRVYRGAFAVNYFGWQYPPWSVAIFLLYVIPPLLVLEIAGYALVARYRTQLSRWFGLKACLRDN
jgi:predicted DCC family thiol-disulfide oxidoreductase YuxK